MAERRAPSPPKGWDKKRAENRAAVHAVPESQPRREDVTTDRAYLVVGPRPICGAETGETIRLVLTASQEGDLIEAGHIVRAEAGHLPVSEQE